MWKGWLRAEFCKEFRELGCGFSWCCDNSASVVITRYHSSVLSHCRAVHTEREMLTVMVACVRWQRAKQSIIQDVAELGHGVNSNPLREWTHRRPMARLYMTTELWPTRSTAASPGSQTTVCNYESKTFGAWSIAPASLIFVSFSNTGPASESHMCSGNQSQRPKSHC